MIKVNKNFAFYYYQVFRDVIDRKIKKIRTLIILENFANNEQILI